MIEEVGLVQFGRRGLEELGVLIVGRIAFEDSSGMGCRVDLLEHSDGDVGVDCVVSSREWPSICWMKRISAPFSGGGCGNEGLLLPLLHQLNGLTKIINSPGLRSAVAVPHVLGDTMPLCTKSLVV